MPGLTRQLTITRLSAAIVQLISLYLAIGILLNKANVELLLFVGDTSTTLEKLNEEITMLSFSC